MAKRISIVFQETGACVGGAGFNVFLEGFEKSRKNLPDDELSAAEFWAKKCFAIVGDVLVNTGAAQTVKQKPEAS